MAKTRPGLTMATASSVVMAAGLAITAAFVRFGFSNPTTKIGTYRPPLNPGPTPSPQNAPATHPGEPAAAPGARSSAAAPSAGSAARPTTSDAGSAAAGIDDEVAVPSALAANGVSDPTSGVSSAQTPVPATTAQNEQPSGPATPGPTPTTTTTTAPPPSSTSPSTTTTTLPKREPEPDDIADC